MKETNRFLDSLTPDGRYRVLVEGITDYAIYMLDPTGIVTSWNPGAQRFKGYEPSEIIGEHFSRFYTEDDRAIGLPAKALEIAEREGKFESEGAFGRMVRVSGPMWSSTRFVRPLAALSVLPRLRET